MMIQLYLDLKIDMEVFDENELKNEAMIKYYKCLKDTLPKDSPFYIIKKIPYILHCLKEN
jgi:hypothetical protein